MSKRPPVASPQRGPLQTTCGQLTLKVSYIQPLNYITDQLLSLMIGAVPKLHGSKQVKKPDYMNQNWDIDRAGPRALHMDLYKVETNLTTNDIEGAGP